MFTRYSMCGHSNLATTAWSSRSENLEYGRCSNNRIHYKFNFHKNHINCQLELWTFKEQGGKVEWVQHLWLMIKSLIVSDYLFIFYANNSIQKSVSLSAITL